jgi:glutamate dehydrogenase/leucine dehydrogenase
MPTAAQNDPALVIEYTDPREGFKGWLVIDRTSHRICAGGMRVQAGLTRAHLTEMARNMTRKMRLADLRVDGAKCGIDYDPAAPGKMAAVGRFLKAIRPYIKNCYSMGPDLNIDMAELTAAATRQAIPSVKMAIAAAQGWELDYFLKRSELLAAPIGNFTLGRLRAGYGVAAAVLAMLETLGIRPAGATVAVQGFGNLAKAALYGLAQAGCRVVAIADAEKCLLNERGIKLSDILTSRATLLPDRVAQAGSRLTASPAIFDCGCDIFVPAAVENTVTPQIAEKIKVRAVVPGANLAVPPESESILFQRLIPVLPDFLAGCGGSLSMEGLYGPDSHPAPQDVLEHVRRRMQELVRQVVAQSIAGTCSCTEAALRICAERSAQPDSRPYGRP